MDTLNQYRQIIQDILSNYSRRRITPKIDNQHRPRTLRSPPLHSHISRLEICAVAPQQ
jgi:hypothetical protein